MDLGLQTISWPLIGLQDPVTLSLDDAITTSLPGIIMVWLSKGSGQM